MLENRVFGQAGGDAPSPNCLYCHPRGNLVNKKDT